MEALGGMMGTPTVLFIDDDRRLILVYAEEIREKGIEARCVHSPDDALAYLRAGEPADVIVWDMMMLPGTEFADVDTEGGTKTGRFLYKAMRELRPDAAFILLTNQMFDADEFEKAEIRSYAHYKESTSPEELASLVAGLVY
jgi:CheY-like chemotaxis protein